MSKKKRSYLKTGVSAPFFFKANEITVYNQHYWWSARSATCANAMPHHMRWEEECHPLSLLNPSLRTSPERRLGRWVLLAGQNILGNLYPRDLYGHVFSHIALLWGMDSSRWGTWALQCSLKSWTGHSFWPEWLCLDLAYLPAAFTIEGEESQWGVPETHELMSYCGVKIKVYICSVT